jgi:WXXGXW repeat (2 copies)
MQYIGRMVGFVLGTALLSGAALLSGCSVAVSDPSAHTAAVAPYPPPPERAEIPPPAPSTDLLWLAGHWNWNGAKYAWTPGHYVQRPLPTANWRPGYWDQESGGWLWTEGHWDS